MLRELGWVEVVRGARDTPRNSELRLTSADELLQMRKELLSLRRNAPAFIGRVFQSHNPIWVDRCSDIIIDKV